MPLTLGLFATAEFLVMKDFCRFLHDVLPLAYYELRGDKIFITGCGRALTDARLSLDVAT